jgi:hypothetical protein
MILYRYSFYLCLVGRKIETGEKLKLDLRASQNICTACGPNQRENITTIPLFTSQLRAHKGGMRIGKDT